ncbi:MAG: DUF512 domain-containing protein, partial [Chloroflexaceae bacterium]|nr:DUF512 domain-containing protein [Chloroflexaceae bacterium]
ACPGVNDGDSLHQSIQALAALYPVVQSIAVVPVGLTRYRFQGKAPTTIRAAIQIHERPEWRPETNGEQSTDDWGFCARLAPQTELPLRCYTPAEANALLDRVLPYSARYRQQTGINLVYPSDEFFLLAERPLPAAAFYDHYPQYSNGVGMTRDFLDGWQRLQGRLPTHFVRPRNMALLCGTMIEPVLQTVVERLNRITNLHVTLQPVVNHFFGETVTVSGLLTGQDVVSVLRTAQCDQAIVPRVMFDYQGQRTLDEYTPERISTESDVSVLLAGTPGELIQCIHTLLSKP